ncbi:hypothetical protein MASR1M32_21010 [Rhodobacter sp.]
MESALLGGLPADRLEVLVESDDGTGYAMVAALPSVRVAVSGAVGSGTGPARNRALARARGDYIACLDADDLLAPGALADLLPLAQEEGAAASALEVEEAGEIILRLWQDLPRLSLADLAASGASVRGLVARGRCRPFADALSQDILQMVQVMAGQGGSLPLSPLPYRLRIRSGSVTAAADFSLRVDAAYRDHIASLQDDPELTPALARAAADVFRTKIALNADFAAQGAARSYYRFIADRLKG